MATMVRAIIAAHPSAIRRNPGPTAWVATGTTAIAIIGAHQASMCQLCLPRVLPSARPSRRTPEHVKDLGFCPNGCQGFVQDGCRVSGTNRW